MNFWIYLAKKIVTCYLIGEDHLLLECADILLSHNHIILGIISALPTIKDYALCKKFLILKNLLKQLQFCMLPNLIIFLA
jgi:hypothetical protein